MGFLPLEHLTLQQQRSKIKIKVSRIWESTIPQLKNEIMSLDCLIIDEKGFSMQATVRKHDVQHFKPLLSEGTIYIIENFNVVPSREKYKVVDRKYMLQINRWTKIIEAMEEMKSIPSYCFAFSTFDYIRGKRNNDTCLLDVIGAIVAVGPITYTYVGQERTPIRNLEIENLENDTFPVTLWDQFALKFDEGVIQENETSGPVVIIFASMSVRNYKDKLYLSSCSASRFYINLEIPDVLAFRNNLQRKETLIGPIQHIAVAQQQTVSPYEQMFTNRKTISELLMLDPSEVENTKYTCEAKLVEIDTTYGWWYKACYDCKRGIKDFDGTFWCNNCGKDDHSPIPWYKLNTIFSDDTASANFTIFGKSAQDLIHVPAQQLATAANSDRFILPSIIKNIIGQTFVLQVALDNLKLNSSMQSFNVIKIFQNVLPAKIKIEEKNEDVVDIEEDGVPTTPKESQNYIVDKASASDVTETRSTQLRNDDPVKQSRGKKEILSAQSNFDEGVKQSRDRKRNRSYIERSQSDEEDE